MKKGFTVVEMVIAVMVFSILSVAIFLFYQKSNSAFSVTLWKQERTVQAERFWSAFRKYIEEATDELSIPESGMTKLNPEVKKIANCPIKVNDNPEQVVATTPTKLLAWNLSTLNFDFDDGLHQSHSDKYYLVKEGSKVYLIASGTKHIAELDDVSSVNFSVKSIVKDSEISYEKLEEKLVTGDKVVGTLLEISLTMTPPYGYVGHKTVFIPQNNKFKLNVAAELNSNPDY